MKTRHTTRLLLALFATSCAYGYAGQEGKVREEQKVENNVEVVEVEQDPSPAAAQAPPAEAVEKAPELPCGVETFAIHFYGDDARIEKRIDCAARKVVHVDRAPLGETTYQQVKAAGLPENEWYLLVDPRGMEEGVLTNAHLLKLSREYQIEYYGRASSGLLVYTYLDDVK